MNIKDKLKRLEAIPKMILEATLDRDRCINLSATSYDKSGTKSEAKENNTEKNMIAYAHDGKTIDELEAEKKQLYKEIEKEIDYIIPDDSADSVDKRIILKSKLLDNISLKKIASEFIHRDYKTVCNLFNEAYQDLKNTTQYGSIPLNTACSNGNNKL